MAGMARQNEQVVMALIPARGGSKSIPNKNILPFHGKPLVVHAIDQSLAAETVSRVIVSTDSEEIAQISRAAGAEVPFLRPAEISGDLATDFEAIHHALTWLDREEGYRPDLVAQVRVTSPLRPSGLIDKGVRLLAAHPQADSLRAVIPAPATPYKMWTIEDDLLCPILSLPGLPEAYNEPRQKLPDIYWQNGYLDVIRWRTVKEMKSATGDKIVALRMSPADDIDIDDLLDLKKALKEGQRDSR